MFELLPIEDEPWETDHEVWESGQALLLTLRGLRGFSLFAGPVDHPRAEAEIAAFCRRLRKSPHLALPRLQRDFHLTNDGVICVLAVFMAYLLIHVTVNCNICEVGMLACGISPCRLQRLMKSLERNDGLGLLVAHDSNWCLSETALLRGKIFGQKISDMDVRAAKNQIEKLPTAKRQGIPDNREDDKQFFF